ncbi:MAG: App1 family protein [Acidimicrobiales bacterium]
MVSRSTHLVRRGAIAAERWWDDRRREKRAEHRPDFLRIIPHHGHAGAGGLVVRARVLDDSEPPEAVPGEGALTALRRTASSFLTDELPDVPLSVTIGAHHEQIASDAEGYIELRIPWVEEPAPGGWVEATIELADTYRGVDPPRTATALVRTPPADARFGVISDIDDTILHTGVQRTWEMVRLTVTGSEHSRAPFAGAPELYRALATGIDGTPDRHPFFYVSSSPWNLHGFLWAFLQHHELPLGPLMLRDFLGKDPSRGHGDTKHKAIDEILTSHPELEFVLIGDSGQHDPEIYAEVVRRHPGRIKAVYIREVRLDPGDGRVEAVADAWNHDIPLLLASDSAAVAYHAQRAGLLSAEEAMSVVEAVERDLLRRAEGYG